MADQAGTGAYMGLRVFSRVVTPAAAFSLLLGFTVSQASAHDAASHVIDRVNVEIATDDDNADLYLKRGKLQAEMAHWNAAMSDYRRAQNLSPEDPNIQFWIGKLLVEKGEPEQALPYLERFLAANDKAPRAHQMLAKAFVVMGEAEQAAEAYSNAIEHSNVKTPQAYIDRAQAMNAIIPVPFKRIEEGLKSGISELGPVPAFYEALIQVAVDTGHYGRAEFWLNEMPDAYAKNPYWQFRRARVYSLQSKRKEANQVYRGILKTIQTLPENRRKTRAMKDLHARALAELRMDNQPLK